MKKDVWHELVLPVDGRAFAGNLFRQLAEVRFASAAGSRKSIEGNDTMNRIRKELSKLEWRYGVCLLAVLVVLWTLASFTGC